MNHRKTLALILAVLVLGGFAFDSNAQTVSATPGWGVIVASPDSAGWAGIGDSVIVKVTRQMAIGTAASEVFVGIYAKTDTITAAALTAVATAASGTVRPVANASGSLHAPSSQALRSNS